MNVEITRECLCLQLLQLSWLVTMFSTEPKTYCFLARLSFQQVSECLYSPHPQFPSTLESGVLAAVMTDTYMDGEDPN